MTTRTASVAELQRAWRAVQQGAFRGGNASEGAGPFWVPALEERVVVVAGCMGQAGTTTVSVAIGSAVDGARLVECCPPVTTGLAAAAYSEFGELEGWARGTRAGLTLLRLGTPDPADSTSAGTFPLPPVVACSGLTVVDVGAGWMGMAGGGWPAAALHRTDSPVLVSRATVPGLRRLETALAMLTAGRAVAAVLGPAVRKWPRELRHAIGTRTQQLLDGGRVVDVALDAGLARTGLTDTPLPGPLLATGKALLDLLEGNPQ